jgi:putative protease
LPRICHDGEVTRALSFAEEGRDLVVANLGLLRPAIDAGALVQSHWSLNVTNAWTARWLGMAGATRIWASPELNGRQLADVASRSGAHVGVSVFGRQELMVTEQCILASQGSCDRNCSSCRRRREAAYLRDRKGYRFPVETDAQGRSHVYNAVPLDLLPALAEVLATGVSAIRVDTATLSVDEATAAVRSARKRLREASEGAQRTTSGRASSKRGAELTTSGHFFRGVG